MKISSLFLKIIIASSFQAITCGNLNTQDMAQMKQEVLTQLLDAAKAKYTNDALLKAIIAKDIPAIASSKEDPNKLIDYTAEFDENNEKIGVQQGQTYLSFAMFVASLDRTEQEKQKSLQVIETLLKKKANPNAVVGQALIVQGKPFEAAYPVTFVALDSGNPQVLELLYSYGAEINPQGTFPPIKLLEVAKQAGKKDFAAIIEKHMVGESLPWAYIGLAIVIVLGLLGAIGFVIRKKTF